MAVVASVLALVLLDVLLFQALLQRQGRHHLGRPCILPPLLSEILQAQTQVKEGLRGVGDAATVLAGGGAL